MPADIPIEIQNLPNFPLNTTPIPPGKYAILSDVEEDALDAQGPNMEYKVWFRSPPLSASTIERIEKIQLFAESRDQGHVDNPLAGNWTWFELAILKNANSIRPREKDDVELIWKSHDNRFQTTEFDWASGQVFGKQHDLLNLLEDGNVIAVRLCARFSGWEIRVERGCLSIEVGAEAVRRGPPTPFGEIASKVKVMQQVMDIVNSKEDIGFKPELPPRTYTGEAFSTAAKKPLRVLSLDGGGVRGLSSLRILKAIMEQNHLGKKPCDVFDMIGGTSTGGLIAIMLGRLGMEVQECIDMYDEIRLEVFATSKFGKSKGLVTRGERHDAAILERKIKQLVARRTNNENALLQKESDPKCRVFVMAVRQNAVNREPVFLRSYRSRNREPFLPGISIWEAGRATSAAPSYFKPIKVGNETLIDGGLGANNPLGWLWNEMLSVFGPARSTACFLSIGTGLGAPEVMATTGIWNLASQKLTNSLSSAATNTESVHALFETLVNAFAPTPEARKYWRLNVIDEKNAAIGALDDNSAVKKFLQITDDYIKENKATIKSCADALLDPMPQPRL